jgi:hypothetical protein
MAVKSITGVICKGVHECQGHMGTPDTCYVFIVQSSSINNKIHTAFSEEGKGKGKERTTGPGDVPQLVTYTLLSNGCNT